ncbi:MAG: spore coat U domain-containing protein [Pseudomonadota bacterium]
MRLTLCLLTLLVMMQISAPAVAGECDASVSLVDFGRLDLERGGQVSGEVIVICDQPGQFSVALSSGIGSYRLRKMRGADGTELKYNLFVDPGRRSIWGDGVSEGTRTIRGESDGRKPLIIPVYGIVPPNQSVLTGPYSDNLLVTVERL